jgi:hypothetical protein
MNHPNKRPSLFRRRLLINAKIQICILLYSVFLAMIVTLLTVLFHRVAQGQFPAMQSPRGFGFITLFFFVTFTSTILSGLYFTNKIVGPIYRLKKHMESAVNGEAIAKIQFRKGDFFSDIAPVYNKLLEKSLLIEK